MNDKIKSYIQSVLPVNLSDAKRQALYDELCCHILDRYEFYKEIGFSDEESTQKAIHDMGEDEETTDYIRNEFDELYFEKTWWAVLAFFGVLALNAIAMVLGVWVVAGDTLGSPSIWRTVVSFFMIALVFFGNWAANHFGCRKTLLAFGFAELIIAASFLFCLFPQPAFYSFFAAIFYCLDRFTPLVLYEYSSIFLETLCAFSGVVFLFIVSIFSFALSARQKRFGAPTDGVRLSTKIGAVVFLFLAAISIFLLRPSEEYFNDYPIWFDEISDSLNEDTAVLFDALSKMESYDEAKEYLNTYGYVCTEDYKNTLPQNDIKKFERNFKNIDFFFGEEYEVYFNPDKTMLGENYDNYSNAFLYLRKSDDGSLTGIGAGNGMQIYGQYGLTVFAQKKTDKRACLEAFEALRAGDSKQTVLKQSSVFGEKYTEFLTKENGVVTEYYRFICDDKPLADEGVYGDGPFLIEFYFKNGILTDATIHYRSYEESGVKDKIIKLNNDA